MKVDSLMSCEEEEDNEAEGEEGRNNTYAKVKAKAASVHLKRNYMIKHIHIFITYFKISNIQGMKEI